MYSKNTQVAIIGCGYWGTNIIKTLISLKISKIYWSNGVGVVEKAWVSGVIEFEIVFETNFISEWIP